MATPQRIYLVPTNVASPGDTLVLRCRLATPVLSDTDYDSSLSGADETAIVPPNLGALKMGLMALNYETENDLERAEVFWAKCWQLLNEEKAAHRGGNRFPLNTMPGGVPSGRTRPRL